MATAAALGPVLVVDDGSRDATAAAARDAGAAVLSLERNQGKGGAVYHGIRTLQTDVVVLLDADLIGLTPEHLADLAAPVLSGAADMSRGVFVGGRWRTSAAQHLAPQLNGQRAVRRHLLLGVPGLAQSRYGVEVTITEHARRHGWKSQDVPMPNVSQVMKEEKLGLLPGLGRRLAMYRDILRAYVRRR
jgi:glycosyltransferase involved in cell wall biosynthesis